jgi:hypothetical protein
VVGATVVQELWRREKAHITPHIAIVHTDYTVLPATFMRASRDRCILPQGDICGESWAGLRTRFVALAYTAVAVSG